MNDEGKLLQVGRFEYNVIKSCFLLFLGQEFYTVHDCYC